MKKGRTALLTCVGASIFATGSFAAEAQSSPELQTVTVTGTRAAPRTVIQSLEPIDSISRESIAQTAPAELNEVIAELVPAFSVQRLPALDGTIFVRPARLDNLSPDQTLVLLNGKRMHRSAMMMNPSYGAAFQAPDLDQVASSALRSIEVLRDGAAAQYGSDAIAGVINLRLDDRAGASLFAQSGQYIDGGGAGPKLGGHFGLRAGESFIALTAEYSSTAPTSRSQQQAFAAAFQAANPTLKIPNPAVRWGQPARDALRLAFNSNYQLGAFSLYSFGTYGKGYGISDFNYRGPNGAVISPTNTYSAGYSAQFLPNAAFPGFSPLSVYPTGFTPHFGQHDWDESLVGGLRRSFGNGLILDGSVNYGRSHINYFMLNSFNFSLGPKSPTQFDDGAVDQEELNFNLDGSIPLTIPGFYKPVTLAFGGEHRKETFTISAGDPASYAIGPGAPALSVGSAGFVGYSPAQSGRHSETVNAGYLDLNLPVTSTWTVAAATRFEDFDAFKSSTTYKVSTRYELTSELAVRGTLATGFHAPSPAQLYGETTSQFLNPALGVLTTGRFSPVGPVAQVLNASGANITPLRPETSKNYSLGLAWASKFGLSATLDLFRIDIRNRINGSSAYLLTPAQNATLTALHVPNLTGIYSASFLQNDYNTSNRGYDLVVTDVASVAKGVLTSTLAINHTDTIVGASKSGAILGTPAFIFKNALPHNRATLSETYSNGRYQLTTRVRYYGAWTDSVYQGSYLTQKIGSLGMVDLIGAYQVSSSVSVKAGVENIFNKYPDKAQLQSYRGLIYSRNAPYNTDGGYYFARLDAKF